MLWEGMLSSVGWWAHGFLLCFKLYIIIIFCVYYTYKIICEIIIFLYVRCFIILILKALIPALFFPLESILPN